MADFVPYIGIALVGLVAFATAVVTRRDERFKIASGERDEYKARAERLAEDLATARAEAARLAKRPDMHEVVARLDVVIEGVEDLQASIDVHADPRLERRQGQIEGAPRRRLSDG